MHTSSSHLSGWENLGFCEIELDSEDFWVCIVLINSRFLQEILSLSSCFCNKNELKANFCVLIMRLNLTHTANYDIIHAISLHVRMQSMKNALDNNFFPHLAREREGECLLALNTTIANTIWFRPESVFRSRFCVWANFRGCWWREGGEGEKAEY